MLFFKLGSQILGFDHTHELDSQDLDFHLFLLVVKQNDRELTI